MGHGLIGFFLKTVSKHPVGALGFDPEDTDGFTPTDIESDYSVRSPEDCDVSIFEFMDRTGSS